MTLLAKHLIGITFLLFANLLLAQDDFDTDETPHFIFKWKEGNASAEEVEEGKNRAEAVYNTYLEYLGVQRIPETKTVVYLGGDAFTKTSQVPKIPYVNYKGEVFLFRYPNGYFGELPHEYFHVLRIHKGGSGDWFLEEGLSECFSSLLFPKNYGFSLYGYPTTIAAGSWTTDPSERIPLRSLKDQHELLNLQCQAQGYPMRADFFRFLLKRAGKEKFLQFAYDSKARNYTTYNSYFILPFGALEAAWLEDLRKRLKTISDAEDQMKAYRNKTSIKFMNVCRKGIQFN